MIQASDEAMESPSSLAQSSASAEPREGPFGHPAARQDFEAFCLVRALDDLDRPAPNLFQPPLKLITA